MLRTASWIRCSVSSLTLDESRSARDTVWVDTPAAAATSAIVTAEVAERRRGDLVFFGTVSLGMGRQFLLNDPGTNGNRPCRCQSCFSQPISSASQLFPIPRYLS
ncbi:hypothetical protein CHELA20_50706 [Hyphomicrobiales bacterium]|nr:hypothetical protein CHELA20_50706 [Hyphomicrobiales bacterium]CAH1676871.1 hypothetical protein CHELA41_24313 [Hyphomicrobiales bacterium]